MQLQQARAATRFLSGRIPLPVLRAAPVQQQRHMAAASNSDIVRLDCGKRLSEAAVHNKTVYLAGQVPEDTTADITGQTAQCLKAVDSLLARAGTDKTRILNAQIFLVDINEFAGMNAAWDAWVPEGASPARATVAGVKLAQPDWKVEIVVTAALP